MVAITSSSTSASASTNGSHEESSLIHSPNDHGPSNEFSGPRKTSRKQWSVQGEPRSLLKRLRSQLAEDGCPESQYQMAKLLLEQTEDINYEDNCHQAVFWLTQSSLQGSLNATNLLKKCLEEGTGICEQNYHDVRHCLEVDHQEKLAAVAGKQLFNSLSEGNAFVTQKKLETKISEIINNKIEDNEKSSGNRFQNMTKTEIKIYLEEKYGSRRLSEAVIVGSAMEFIKGEIPSIQLPGLRLGNTQTTFWSQFIKFHESILNVMEVNILKKTSLIGNLPRPYYFVILASVLYLLYNCTLSKIYTLAFVSVWLLSFVVMTYSAMAIMIRLKNKNLFYVWGRVFQDFNQELNVDIATNRHKNKYIQYYIALFGCILTYLIMLPVIDAWLRVLTAPPLVIVSFCLITSSFRSNFSFYMFCSLFYFLAHYSDGKNYIKNTLFNVAPSLRPFILEESFNIYDILHLNLDIGSVFHSLWIASLAFVSLTIGASGILFHILCVFWFHLTSIVTNEQFGCWTYISFLLWSLFFFLPRGFNFLSIMVPAFSCSLSCYTSGLGYVITFSVFLITYCFLQILHRLNPKLASTMKCISLVLSFVILFQQPVDGGSKISSLKWDQYQNVCLPTKESIEAHTVHSCSPFRGLAVEWQATIKQIEVESVLNIPELLLSIFPPIIQQHLKCSFPIPKPPCEDINVEKDRQRCHLLEEVKGTSYCSLNHWNDYRFRFFVIMETNFWKFTKNCEVVLMAGNDFVDAAFTLSVHDKVTFVGTLDDGIGTSLPKVTLTSLKCLECKSKLLLPEPVKEQIDYEKLSMSIKSAFNFIFGPTLTV